MAKSKGKSGNKKKPAKAKKAKAPAKAKAPKAPKAPKEKKAKAPKVSSPVVSIPKVTAPVAPEQPIARVVETPKEEVMVSAPAVTTAPPIAPAPQAEPDAIDLMAKSLNKTVLSYERGITKAMLEDYLSKLPNNLPYYITPRYEANSFTIEITDGTKKVTIPSTGSYALIG